MRSCHGVLHLGNFHLKSESMSYGIGSRSMRKGRNIVSFPGPLAPTLLSGCRWGRALGSFLFASLPAVPGGGGLGTTSPHPPAPQLESSYALASGLGRLSGVLHVLQRHECRPAPGSAGRRVWLHGAGSKPCQPPPSEKRLPRPATRWQDETVLISTRRSFPCSLQVASRPATPSFEKVV